MKCFLNLVMGILCFCSSMFGETSEYCIPHMTSQNPWVNKIVIFNTGTVTKDCSLTVWNSEGEESETVSFSVNSYDKTEVVMTSYSGYISGLDNIILDSTEGTCILITEDDCLVPVLSYQYGNSESISQFFLNDGLSEGYLLPNVHESHFDWTGIAVMNQRDNDLLITFSAYQDGILRASDTVTVNPMCKFVDITETMWGGLELDDFDQIIVSADQTFPAPVLITGNNAQDRHVFFSGIPINVTDTNSEITLIYPIVDTGQTVCYDESSSISSPSESDRFFGQDAQYAGNSPSYTDNGDGTITDNVTGLMWQKDPGEKMTLAEAQSIESTFSLAGYNDWRLPTIKELYSLIQFSGKDPSSYTGTSTNGLIPFIDTDYFVFNYGDVSEGERIIDSQMATSTIYTSTTMGGNRTMFGVNFADGRIKGYPADALGPGGAKTFYVYYVRGGSGYGENNFVDNGDGTVSDNATGLMWTQGDSGDFNAGVLSDGAMNWEDALEFAESFEYADYDDWRLPNAKELQSIVDYSRSPDVNGSAAIDPVFHCTGIINEGGDSDFPFYWSSTTHANRSSFSGGSSGAYVSFGRALGFWNNEWTDVHGAGAQRSDPKNGNPNDYPEGHGPQGDAIRIYNYVRLVRNIS